ncbi:MAG: nucleotidyltransferase domain-containing protein [Bacteroidales bacterium]|nr:nucleotidyltransferase domain-containing protein [Bacteroidales bacterium]
MKQEDVIKGITELGRKILPEGSSLWLYGSRARGDARPDSDYDLLILLDKEKLDFDDNEKYGYPLFYWGTGFGEAINAHLYTRKDWNRWRFAPFQSTVEEDKKVLI